MATITIGADSFTEAGKDAFEESEPHDRIESGISCGEQITITHRRGGVVTRIGYKPKPAPNLTAPLTDDPNPGDEPSWYLDSHGMPRIFGKYTIAFSCFPDPDGAYPRPGGASAANRVMTTSKYQHITDDDTTITNQSGMFLGYGDTSTGISVVSDTGGTLVLTETFYYHNSGESPEVDYTETWTWTFENEYTQEEFIAAAVTCNDTADWIPAAGSGFPWTMLDDETTVEDDGTNEGTLEDVMGFTSPIHAGSYLAGVHFQVSSIKFKVLAKDWYIHKVDYDYDWTSSGSSDTTQDPWYNYDYVWVWDADGELATYAPLLTNP